MISDLIKRYPQLEVCGKDIERATEIIAKCYKNGGKLLLAGNGGSCADCEHISGELLKGFLKKRPLSDEKKKEMKRLCPELDDEILAKLQSGLAAIPLPTLSALTSAFGNDVDSSLAYAQATISLGKSGDVLLAISTSGNAENVVNAARVAKSIGMRVIALTGGCGGSLRAHSEVSVIVPEWQTYKIQELHLPIYHAICAEIESRFFNE